MSTVTYQTFHNQTAVIITTFHQNAPLTLLSTSDLSGDATCATTGEELRLLGQYACVLVLINLFKRRV